MRFAKKTTPANQTFQKHFYLKSNQSKWMKSAVLLQINPNNFIGKDKEELEIQRQIYNLKRHIRIKSSNNDQSPIYHKKNCHKNIHGMGAKGRKDKSPIHGKI